VSGSDDHVVGPARIEASAIINRPGRYLGVTPTFDAMRAFISGLDLAVIASQSTTPLTDEHRRLLRSEPDGEDVAAITTLEPVLEVLLEAVRAG
jgi:hypothetical protein